MCNFYLQLSKPMRLKQTKSIAITMTSTNQPLAHGGTSAPTIHKACLHTLSSIV